MKFRLTTVLYLFALLAASLAAFGDWGVCAFCMVVVVWAAVLHSPPLKNLKWVILTAVVVVLLIGFLLPAVQTTRRAARWASCRNNLKLVWLALQSYESEAGRLPPAVLKNSKAEPLHSWRTAILPYAEQPALYASIDHSQAWNSPANAANCAVNLDWTLRCPSCRSGTTSGLTNYFAVVDEKTLWPPDGAGKSAEIPDGAGSTLLLIEASPPSPWAEPRDLSFDEAVDLLSSPIVPAVNGGHELRHDGYFYRPRFVRHAAMADGSVLALRGSLPRATASALLTTNGGEEIDLGEIERLSSPQLDYGKIARHAIFAVVALLPAGRLASRSRRRPAKRTPARRGSPAADPSQEGANA